MVFLDIFTFITRASMIYRLSLSELIKFQTFLDCCVQCLSVIRDHHHIYLRVSDMTHPILHLLSGPGAADHHGGAPQSVPGRVWVARVIPSQLSQSEASIEPSDQSEASILSLQWPPVSPGLGCSGSSVYCEEEEKYLMVRRVTTEIT